MGVGLGMSRVWSLPVYPTGRGRHSVFKSEKRKRRNALDYCLERSTNASPCAGEGRRRVEIENHIPGTYL